MKIAVFPFSVENHAPERMIRDIATSLPARALPSPLRLAMEKNTRPLLLIVDDSRMSRMLLRALIADSRPDWRIAEAANGDEALALIDSETPDFVSMDVNMPGLSGLEAAGRIRLRHPETRVALCTANIQESIRESAARAGVHFVAKPITAQSVADAIAFFEA